jgi:tetratricopeptide (TPR) repeat protein
VSFDGCATIAGVRWCAAVLTLLVLLPLRLHAQDALAEARRLYNAGQFEEAERAARTALEQPANANSARVVLGRIQLERYRKTPSEGYLTEARQALRETDPQALDARERIELTLGFAETLFLEDRFLSAADLFEPTIDASIALGPTAHARVLDWWASAVDRHAQTRPFAERGAIYTRITERMQAELSRDAGSVPASYWIVAAARGAGDLDAAWSAAAAAWVRAVLTPDRGVILRGDLDRLVVHALIPERAARLSPRDPSLALTGLQTEWDAFKASWTR